MDAFFAGAGDGNRTHTASLEGWNSTIELHPQNDCLNMIAQCFDFVNTKFEFFSCFFEELPIPQKQTAKFFEFVEI